MEDNTTKKETFDFDLALIDPRLKEDSQKAPTARNCRTKASNTRAASSEALSSCTETVADAGAAHDPAPTSIPLADPWWDAFEDDMVDEDTVFPETAYRSLDYLTAFGNMQGDERTWLMGLQAGIGLGIHSAREAMLNEMQNEGTVFGRQIQKTPSDPDPYQMRMQIGQQCKTGFDCRVAYRAANRFIRDCGRVSDIVSRNGLASCLPDTGNQVVGTSMFFSEEDVARCQSISRKIDEFFRTPEDELQSFLNIDSSASQAIDGLSTSAVDVSQLIDTTALTFDAMTYRPASDVALPSCELSEPGLLGGMDVKGKVNQALGEVAGWNGELSNTLTRLNESVSPRKNRSNPRQKQRLVLRKPQAKLSR